MTKTVMMLVLSLVACGTATVGTTALISIPPDSVARCTSFCQRVDLRLQSIVILANQIGCVCNVPPSPDH